MVQQIVEHTVDLSLIPESGANILDLGCLGFSIRNYFKNQNHNIYSVNIAELDDDNYYRIAISTSDGRCGVKYFDDKQATQMMDGNEIEKMTLDTFSKFVGIEKWDLIKMDIEGEEFNILSKATHPIAKQVSVEFHAHLRVQTKQTLDALLDTLSQWYEIHNRVWDARHGAGFNYWDVLLISK